jgi:hypothetical protein
MQLQHFRELTNAFQMTPTFMSAGTQFVCPPRRRRCHSAISLFRNPKHSGACSQATLSRPNPKTRLRMIYQSSSNQDLRTSRWAGFEVVAINVANINSKYIKNHPIADIAFHCGTVIMHNPASTCSLPLRSGVEGAKV